MSVTFVRRFEERDTYTGYWATGYSTSTYDVIRINQNHMNWLQVSALGTILYIT